MTHLFYCLIYMAIAASLCFVAGRIVPKRLFNADAFPYREFGFEKGGKFYEKFNIKKWQSRVPDMSRTFYKLMPKKAIQTYPSTEKLLLMIRETCVAELFHYISIVLGFGLLIIWPSWQGVLLCVLYIVVGNLPFIIIQRYNRPRLKKVRKMLIRKKKRKPSDVLILSCNTGGGHNSVAEAMKEHFEAQGLLCDIEDTLAFITPRFSKLISGTHSIIYHYFAWIFGVGWKAAEETSSAMFSEKSPVRKTFDCASPGLERIIKENGYKTVLCVHVFAAIIASDTIKKSQLQVQCARIETDYMNSIGADATDVDYHFVPDKSVIEDLVSKGVLREKIVPSGIPLRNNMYQHVSKEHACAALGVPASKKHIVIAFGSEGNIPFVPFLSMLLKNKGSDVFLSIVCASNDWLKRKLDRLKRKKNITNMRAYGFTKQMPLLLDSADLYVAKPGGISCTEAAVKGLPTVLVQIVAGCEKYNKEFFCKNNAAVTFSSQTKAAKGVLALIDNSRKLKELSNAMTKVAHPNARDIISRTLGYR